jgi:chromosomal replication initiation ATPase DnaA
LGRVGERTFLSDIATIERIHAIESELKLIRVEAYRRAGIPLPIENKQIGRVVEFAAVAFAVSDGAILGPTRAARVVRARDAIAWVADQAFGTSSVAIGRALGERDHSTVLAALRRAQQWREADDDYREITDRLLAMVIPRKREEAENAPSSH